MAPRENEKGPIWPFPFSRLQAYHRHSILKDIPGLEMQLTFHPWQPEFSKNSGLVAMMATTFP